MIGYYMTLRKDENLQFVETWMKLEVIMLNKISHRDKGTNIFWIILFFCGIDKEETNSWF